MRFSLLVFILTLFSWVGISKGLIFKKSVEELTEEATIIVIGKIIAVESYWNDAHNRIWSNIKIQPTEFFKGNGGPTISFRVPGGTVGDTTLHVSDAPNWKVGEEVLLFLNPSYYYPVVGWFQGKYLIQDDMAINEMDPQRNLPLTELISLIQRALKE